jgi:hypothetical protein
MTAPRQPCYRRTPVSTVITLVLVPVVYTIFDDWGIRSVNVWPGGNPQLQTWRVACNAGKE